MAATVSNLGRGNYVLGGLGAVRGPSAADAMIENQQEARAAREAELLAQQRRQQMQLAQSEEARAQARFKAEQAARAAAQAQRAAQQRAFAEYTQSLRTPPEVPAAEVRRPMADFRTPTTEGVFPLVPTTPRAGITLPGVLPAAPAAAPTAPLVGPRITGAPRGRYRPDEGPTAGLTIPPSTPAAPVPGVVRVAGTSGAVPSTVPTSSGRVIPLYMVEPSYRPFIEQGLAAGPDPVYTTSGGDGYFVYSDGRVFDVENALSGGDPFDVPANVQDDLRARVGVTAAPQPAPESEVAGMFGAPEQPVTPATPAAPAVPVVAPTAVPVVPVVPAAPAAPAAPTAGGIPVLPDGSPDWAVLEQQFDALQPSLATPDMTPYSPVPLGVGPVTEVDPTASAAMQDWQALSRRADIYNAATRIGNSVLAPTGRLADYALRTPEEGVQRAELEAQRQRVRDWYASDEAQAIFQEDPDLLQVAARYPLGFYAQRADAAGRVLDEGAPLSFGTGEGAERDEGPVLSFGDERVLAGAETFAPPVPPAPERTPPERTGQDPFITEQETETGPIAGLTPAGERDPVAATEAAVRAAPDQDASRYFIDNPNLVLDLQTQMARERQMLEARLRYAEATQNIALYEQTFASLNSRQRVVNENMISGQIAIIAAQQDNFGPLQEFLQRARPNDNLQVIPYTDGTVSFFVNGREDGDPIPVADLLEGLAQTFNTEYRAALAAAAELQAEREQFLFENATLQQLQAQREISVAQAKILAEVEAKYGEVKLVSDLRSGDKLFQVRVPGQGYVQFRVVEAGEPLVNGLPAPAATIEVVPNDSLLR